jgi:hypothetical protein
MNKGWHYLNKGKQALWAWDLDRAQYYIENVYKHFNEEISNRNKKNRDNYFFRKQPQQRDWKKIWSEVQKKNH